MLFFESWRRVGFGARARGGSKGFGSGGGRWQGHAPQGRSKFRALFFESWRVDFVTSRLLGGVQGLRFRGG